jgi:protein-disulfide isomerase
VFKHHPLDIHQDAPLAHAASLAAGAQGKFWEFHDRLFANPGKLNREDLLRYARELGLDAARFERDLLDARLKQVIDADRAEAVSLGATGTPAFFVNGRYLSGAKPFEEFAKLINAELGRLRLPVPPEATQR